MVKCGFCGKEESSFRGVHLIKNDGSIVFFDSSKCRKNALKLERDNKKFKWTEAYRVARAHAEGEAAKKAKKEADKAAAEKVSKK